MQNESVFIALLKVYGRMLPVAVLAALLGTVSTLHGQQAKTAAAELHTDANDVSLDLVVRDGKHKAVTDLKPEDLEVTDNGTPVSLTGLRLVNGGDTNHLLTLIFDPLPPDEVSAARDGATRILKAVAKQQFSLAVLKVDGRLRLEQRFTSEKRALEEAVTRATAAAVQRANTKKISDAGTKEDAAAQPEVELISVARTGKDGSGKQVSASDRALSQSLFAALGDAGKVARDEHIPPSLAAMLALVRSQQSVAGRKAIVYFTHSRAMDKRSEEVLESIMGEANRIGLSLYVVDLNGLDHGTHQEIVTTFAQMGGVVSGATRLAGATGGRGATPINPRMTTDSHSVRNGGSAVVENSPIQKLAEGTGGSFIGSDENFRGALEQMVRDMTTYYVATYKPAIRDYDGEFRPTSVKTRRAGARVRTKSGYYAVPPNAGPRVRPFELPLLKILNEPQLPTDVALQAKVLRLGELPNLDSETVAVEASMADVEIRRDTNTKLYSAHVAILARIRDASGAVIESFSDDLPQRGALEKVEEFQAETVTLQRHFIAPPGEYTLEATVLDYNSGRAGAQRIAFTIPKPEGPSLSDLVLVRRMQPVDSSADSLEPLQYGSDKIIPDISGQARHAAKEISVFFIAHPEIHAPEMHETDTHETGAATFDIQLLSEGKALKHPPAAQPVNGAGASSYLAKFPIGSLPDGNYLVKATIHQGGRSSESTLAFALAGGEPQPPLSAEEEASEAKAFAAAIESAPAGPLKFAAAQAGGNAPPPAELNGLLADATRRAADYSTSLPNFICIQVTNRSVIDPLHHDKWKRRDKIVEVLTFRENVETRTILEVNGMRRKENLEHLMGAVSYGEFGGVLKSVFQPSSKTTFQWKEAGALGDGTVQVFDYHVARENSTFYLRLSNVQQAAVGFHGQVFIDGATRSVRRITMEADELKDFPMHQTSVSVDYEYVVINNHDYLLPAGGRVSLRLGRANSVLNEIEFRDFRRFGSNANMVGAPEDAATVQSTTPALQTAPAASVVVAVPVFAPAPAPVSAPVSGSVPGPVPGPVTGSVPASQNKR